MHMKKRLWYKQWTETYMEGLPIGNGRLAAMVLGKPQRMRIALNHEWMWRGENRFREYPDVSSHLQEVREALLSDDFLQGTALANRYFGGLGGKSGIKNRVDPYQPAGDVWIAFDCVQNEQYIRSLNLDTGLSETSFISENGSVSEKLFVSCKDDCIVGEIRTENRSTYCIELDRITDQRCFVDYCFEENAVWMKGVFLDGISFEVCVRVQTDGCVNMANGKIQISDASCTIMMIQIGTDAKGNSPRDEMTFPENNSFDELLTRHTKAFSLLKGTAELDIDVEDLDLPTDQRIEAFRAGKDPAMPLLYFEYGRYLLASGSSGELPLNLQGKWNEELQPPWDADYHLNINLQMCYWFSETLGMHHASHTLFNLIERYVPYGRVMAKHLYGCDGVTFTLQTDVWGRVTPEACGCAVWIGAAPWLGQHMFMHWRYTRDEAFLKERCYPFLKEAARFFEDYLMEKDGKLWVIPSQSPENKFEGTGDWPISIGYNCAMDIELITELMNNAAECADLLGIDAEKATKWRSIAVRLPALTMDSDGRMNEWDKERAEIEPGHRHLSHLYGLYPSELFQPDSWEWRAAERSLDVRLSHGGGHTGWSRSWVACLMARLGRAEDAWKHFIALIGDFATISLLDLHPPRIFQIDGNMGGTAAVCEMLMQSRRGQLKLLPALPKAWPNGKVQGFCAQDTLLADFEWKDGKLKSYALSSEIEQHLQISSGDKVWEVDVKPGEKVYIEC